MFVTVLILLTFHAQRVLATEFTYKPEAIYNGDRTQDLVECGLNTIVFASQVFN